MSSPLRILLLGTTGRTDCIAEAFTRSAHPNEIYALSDVRNPGLLEKCARLEVGAIDDIRFVEGYADEVKPDFVFVGQEQPIAAGVIDALRRRGIPSVAPTKRAGTIETSKSFARNLIQRHSPQYNPVYRHFQKDDGLNDYMVQLGSFVIKADGLAGGKGVKVIGEHFQSISEGMTLSLELLAQKAGGLLIEEKLEGEEFSIQSFCDGKHILHSPPVQDHKRAFPGDKGPMTGGMGSYSCFDHHLPFLSSTTVREAEAINELVFQGLQEDLQEIYQGILYGNFILTATGLKVIEYNARLGDPEAMNILPIMKNDFVDVCLAILKGGLQDINIEYEAKSTVCKWIAPKGYPTSPTRGIRLEPNSIPKATGDLRVYFGAVDYSSGAYELTGSRAIAFLGIGETLSQAEQIAERAASAVMGSVFHREDIGTEALVQRRVQHILQLSVPRRIF